MLALGHWACYLYLTYAILNFLIFGIIWSQHLQCRHCMWSLFCVLASLLPVQLPINDLGKQHKMAYVLQLLFAVMESWKKLLLLALAWPSLDCCGHLGGFNQQMKNLFICLLFCRQLVFQINEYIIYATHTHIYSNSAEIHKN